MIGDVLAYLRNKPIPVENVKGIQNDENEQLAQIKGQEQRKRERGRVVHLRMVSSSVFPR